MSYRMKWINPCDFDENAGSEGAMAIAIGVKDERLDVFWQDDEGRRGRLDLNLGRYLALPDLEVTDIDSDEEIEAAAEALGMVRPTVKGAKS